LSSTYIAVDITMPNLCVKFDIMPIINLSAALSLEACTIHLETYHQTWFFADLPCEKCPRVGRTCNVCGEYWVEGTETVIVDLVNTHYWYLILISTSVY
jgi:hypothetical protein